MSHIASIFAQYAGHLQSGHLGEGKTWSKDHDCQVEAGQKDVADIFGYI